MVNEPEAASHFIARELRAKDHGFVEVGNELSSFAPFHALQWGDRLMEHQAGACYVLCDAGGGTVDVVSFQVKRCDSLLEVERVTSPRSEYTCHI